MTVDGTDAVYRAQRQRLVALVAERAATIWAANHGNQTATLAQLLPLVEAGQRQVVALVSAYMTAKTAAATGNRATLVLDADLYTTAILRGVSFADVYSRPWAALYHMLDSGSQQPEAVTSALASLDKLVRTDLQLAQTHSARDLMSQPETRVVGWRRVLNGPTSCPLCTAAATRTYRTADLMPIHEHCDCTVEPLWGTESVASVGTTVRVDADPELGPRLMADSWSPVGPRIL